MEIQAISSGEIEKGMYIVAFESTEIRYVNDPFTGALKEEVLHNRASWFKGVPYEVISRAGPVLMVKSAEQGAQCPSVVFFDSRLVKFFEVDKEYFDFYIQHMEKHKQQ